MKTIRLSALGALASILFFAACQRSAHKEINSVNDANSGAAVTSVTEGKGETTGRQRPHNGACNPYAYTVLLESRTQVGSTWEWVWSVQNTNPGNGTNGTVQDLSHWGMQFGSCFTYDFVSAGYSADGANWTSFAPSMQVDPSQGCMTSPVLKFDAGTSGSSKTYYKVVVNTNYDVQMVPGYYKSGANTGCCTFQFEGIGCLDISSPR